MPKPTKRQKEKKADFVKAKLKLGKGKKSASNATDTSFKARSIALPGQEALNRALLIAEGNGPTEPTTANGLTLDDLIVRLRHPNAGVRKDTLGGIKEVLQFGVAREIGKVLRALGGIVADDDVAVRKTLLGLLEWYLAQLPHSILSPHLSLLVLQTSSALSHIFPEIRLDACKLVQLLLHYVPSHVVSSWPYETSNILEGLRLAIGLSGEKGANSQIGRLTGGAKLVTMRAMRDFVQIGLESKGKKRWGEGYVDDGVDPKGKVRRVDDEITLEGMQLEGWLVGVQGLEDLAEGGNAWEVGRLGSHGGSGDEEGVVSVLSQLYIQLHPLLLSTFLENAPTAFSPSNPSSAVSGDIPLALCVTTATLTESLANAILTRATPNTNSSELKQVKGCISDFHRRMTGWFPFHSRGPTPSGVSPGFELSLAYADLAVLLAPRPVELVFPQQTDRKRRENAWRERVRATEAAWKIMREAGTISKGKGKAGQGQWAMEEVAVWAVDVLTPSQDILSPALTPEAYTTLLPIIWALLVQPPLHQQLEDTDIPSLVGSAFVSHLIRQQATSSIRALGDEFLITLISVHEKRYPTLPFYIPHQSPARPLIKEWFGNLPKALLELESRKEETTEKLLCFLLNTGLKGGSAYEQPFSLLDPAAFPSLASNLAPFFHLHHPSKGPIPGAWTELASPGVRKLALDVASVWKEWDQSGQLSEAVAMACGREGEWAAYWRR